MDQVYELLSHVRTHGHYEALMCSLIEDHQSKVVTEVLGHDVNVLISKHSLKRECSYASFFLILNLNIFCIL